MTMKTFFTFRTEWYFGTRTAVQAWTGGSATWCPQRRSRLCQAARTAATCTWSRGGARCRGAALSASKFRRGAARQSTATSMAGSLVNFSSAAVQLPKKQSQSLRLDPYVHTQRTWHQCQSRRALYISHNVRSIMNIMWLISCHIPGSSRYNF